MEINKYALTMVIRSTRLVHQMAENIRALAPLDGENMADQVAGELADALFLMNGEHMDMDEDFSTSRTSTFLFDSKLTDSEVANEFIRMAEQNFPKQPKPVLVSRDQFAEMVKKFGGYSTPEGEWK